MAADPDHVPTDGMADPARWPALRNQSLAARCGTQLVSATSVYFQVIGMDQHFAKPSFVKLICLRSRPAGRCFALLATRR
jgi:hypothetical protein